ncbi:MAG: 23S rRNA (adenine(2030)-N(6))-methyltransferase RlmJ, partial [Rhodobacterales bacterium 17-64-5]
MLSYQHLYHAGNLADVHKHSALAWMLDYLTRKDKPLSYIETHAGRGVYDLSAPEAVKTGEAAAGIALAESVFPPDHPYRQRLDEARAGYGPQAYPGSPLIAALGLREGDTLHLAELHRQEVA